MKNLLRTSGLALLLCAFTTVSWAAQEGEKVGGPPLSPRLAALQKQLEAGDRAALESFWEQISKQGTPLIEPIPGDDRNLLVTFLWRGGDEIKNVVVFSPLGNLWDYTRETLAQHQMTRLLDTDVWYKSYAVRKDARFTYYVSPNDSLLPSDERKEDRDWATWQADSLNPHRLVLPHEERDWVASVVELPDAAPQPWLEPQPGVPQGKVELHSLSSKILGNERRIWVYTPPGYSPNHHPYSLLILFDGWVYSHQIPTATLLDNLVAQGRLPSFVAVMVDQSDRYLELGCYKPFNDFLVQELVPWVRQNYRVTSDPTRTVVGGASRGGLAAAFAGLQHPEIFGNVLSQSGQFSWPYGEVDEEKYGYGWLVRQFVATPKLGLRFHLDVGLMEKGPWGLLLSNRHMRDVLVAKGYTVHYVEVNGGHEQFSYRARLADALLFLAGGDTSRKNARRVR